MDYMRKSRNSENVIPRWERWGPDCWHGLEGIKVWNQFLSLTGKVDYAIGDNINYVCGNIHNSLNNEHGEADYAVWHH